jgi:DNA-directed RNA polymerase omega subunit
MSKTKRTAGDSFSDFLTESPGVGIDSRYRLVIVAALRSKQLLRGATPRIVADPLKRKNTSIALEEVKQGLVTFSIIDQADLKDGHSKRLKLD